MANLGIYIHIPFCSGKCPYCNFYSVNYRDELEHAYINALCAEIKKQASAFKSRVDSIYIGGGSPNLIKAANLEKIISAIYKNFSVSDCETTIELNPSCHRYVDFKFLKDIGVNRLSFGVQSVNKDELAILGRKHTQKDTELAIEKARFYGIFNISIDLIIGVPSQTEEKILNSLNFCMKNEIPHISVYILKIEQGTIYFQNKETLLLPDDDRVCDFYLLVDKILSESGYTHYEISNFCKFPQQSKHNLKYWNAEQYLGVGPSAHSFVNRMRYYYPNSINEFIVSPTLLEEGKGGFPEEYAMLRLRLSEGLKNQDYKLKFKRDIPNVYYHRAMKYESLGYLLVDGNSIQLTPKGFLVSNSIIANIIYG